MLLSPQRADHSMMQHHEQQQINQNIPLASPMRWDPHSGQLNFLPLAPLPPVLAAKEPLFLGLDLSTQSLKGCFVNETLDVIAQFAVGFDKDLPHYRTSNGVHMSEGGVVTSPTIMFVEAVDLLFSKIILDPNGKDMLARTAAISGAAQQHATVYWAEQAESILGNLSSGSCLMDQFKYAFSRAESPNWQDSSTTLECAEMEEAVGGPEAMAQRTGSRAHQRFSGPQIMKWRKSNPEAYSRTSRISLVSSFLTTLLCADGQIKPMEESDACGMNLWNLQGSEGGEWDQTLLALVGGGNMKSAEDLERKLGPIERDGGVVAGKVGKYFVDRYGLNADAIVSHFTGDNPGTMLSFSLQTGEVVVSLGTSDTVLLSTIDYAPHPDSHIFSYPANRKGGKRSYMAMLCYKNGSLARESVRDTYSKGSWELFNQQVEDAGQPRGESIAQRPFGFYFLKPEIIPRNVYGVHRFTPEGEVIKEFEDPAFNPRAILESQFLSFRTRVQPLLNSSTPDGTPRRVFAVGGGSANTTLLSTLSDVLSAPVHRATGSSSNSCAIGGCMKAFWCWTRITKPDREDWVFERTIREAQSRKLDIGAKEDLVAVPSVEASSAYGLMAQRFVQIEEKLRVDSS